MALFNRALAKSHVGQRVAAMSDASEARRISGELVRAYGARGDPLWERVRDAAEQLLHSLDGPATDRERRPRLWDRFMNGMARAVGRTGRGGRPRA
jgi:hypothetical protein